MAVIGKIREKSGLLILVIGLAMLMFILGDLFKNGCSGSIEQQHAGMINGEPISYEEIAHVEDSLLAEVQYEYSIYFAQINNCINQSVQNGGDGSECITPEQREQLNNEIQRRTEDAKKRAFSIAVQNRVLKNMQNQGLVVSSDELSYSIFNLPAVNKEMASFLNMQMMKYTAAAFGVPAGFQLNEAGVLPTDSITKTKMQFENYFNNPQFQQQQQVSISFDDVWGKGFRAGEGGGLIFSLEHAVRQKRLADKYNNMVLNAMYVTSKEAEREVWGNTAKRDVRFVIKRYNSVSDSVISYTDEDLKAYYEEHKDDKEFEGKDAVRVQYITMNMIPSEEDDAMSLKKAQNMIESFAATTRDSSYVINKSDVPSYVPRYITKEEVPAIAGQLESAKIGDVVGPYKEGNFYKISKVVDTTMVEAKVRHILLNAPAGSDTVAIKARMDSIKNVIRMKNNFEEMVTEFSDDQGSVAKGGVYEWFNKYKMVPEFTDASFNGKIGELNIVKTTYGYHLVEVLERRVSPQFKLATIQVEIKPYEATRNKYKQDAFNFRMDADKNGFEEQAEEMGYNVMMSNDIFMDTKFLPFAGDGETYSFVKWAFNAQEGEISEAKIYGNTVVVAQVVNKQEKGPKNFESVKDIVKIRVIKEKKAEFFANQMKGSSLNEIAMNVGGQVLSDKVFFNKAEIVGGGNEQGVIGEVMAMPLNTVSEPLVGRTGVYVVEVVNETIEQSPEDAVTVQWRMVDRLKTSSRNRIVNALMDAYGAEDNRLRNEIYNN